MDAIIQCKLIVMIIMLQEQVYTSDHKTLPLPG